MRTLQLEDLVPQWLALVKAWHGGKRIAVKAIFANMIGPGMACCYKRQPLQAAYGRCTLSVNQSRRSCFGQYSLGCRRRTHLAARHDLKVQIRMSQRWFQPEGWQLRRKEQPRLCPLGAGGSCQLLSDQRPFASGRNRGKSPSACEGHNALRANRIFSGCDC